MSEVDIERAYVLFSQLRDQFTHHCGYRYTEREAFAKAVASVAAGPAAEQSSPIECRHDAGQRKIHQVSPNKIPHQ